MFRDPGSTKKPWKWSDEQQNAFDNMTKIRARETSLAYPKLKIPFEIHPDASAYQLGTVYSRLQEWILKVGLQSLKTIHRTGVHRSEQQNKTKECNGAHYELCRSQE
jgi:hypothetical protein